MENKIRPELTKDININDFKNFYWLKEELTRFCRQYKLPTSGGKIDITNRILKFLETGTIEVISPKTKSKTEDSSLKNQELSVNTVITKDYKNSEQNRAFFKSAIGPHFHFTVSFMNFFKNNIGKTYQDAINEWNREYELKKQGKFKTTLGKQFEYNQFFRDFFSDPQNKDKTRQDAIKIWNIKKTLPEARKYSPNDLKYLD